MYNSNATISIQTGNELIPCGSVYSESQECIDRLLSYDIYNTYACNMCSNLYTRDKVGEQVRYWCPSGDKFYNPITGQSIPEVIECEHNQNIISSINTAQHKDGDITPPGVVCECGGNLLPSDDLILSENYTVLSNTVKCKIYPDWENRRDEVWRYYFYNTYICNSCEEVFPRNKTALYEDWGFCAHGGGGKYPLNEDDPWRAEI